MFEIVKATYLNNYEINLEFADGTTGIIDFSDYAKKPGLFRELSNIEFFRRFKIDNDLGTLVWENGLDIAPETLYSKISGIIPEGLLV